MLNNPEESEDNDEDEAKESIYLIKEVDDATVWFYIFWDQMPLGQVVNNSLKKVGIGSIWSA